MNQEAPGVMACPSCRASGLEPVYQQDGVPVHSCLLLDDPDRARGFPTGTLCLGFCPRCGFLCNTAFEPERLSYDGRYEETQACSPRFRAFLEDQVRDLVDRHGLSGKMALEIGCGKGEFLVELLRQGLGQAVGLDPGIQADRIPEDVRDRLEFFAELYREDHTHRHMDLLACRHTLEHIPDPADFLGGVRRSLKDGNDPLVFFELPDVRRILTEGAFWDVYYEHCSYFSAGSLARLFRRERFDVTRVWGGYDDQYLMLEARAAASAVARPHPAEESIEDLSREVHAFRQSVGATIQSWRERLSSWHALHQKVVFWGSGSKAVACLSTVAEPGWVTGVVDINPHKHGRYLAGSGQRILAPAELRALQPDVVLAMNPIYRDEIGAALSELGLSCRLLGLGAEGNEP